MTLDAEKIYRTYFMQVYSYVMNMVKIPDVAEEITQNTFVKAMTTRSAYKKESGEYTWLCSIAKNLCNDYFRAGKKVSELSDDIEISSDYTHVEDDLITHESSFMLHKLLHELEEPYREVFELRVFGELSFAEIAEIFARTESWARVTYHRAKLKIKERMDSYETDRR